MKKKTQVGIIGVDSGQILICDPCYIASEWDREDRYKDRRVYIVGYKGQKRVIDMARRLAQGIKFDDPLIEFDGKTMNDLMKEGLATPVGNAESHVFGYNGCCLATESEKQAGQLNYKAGHAGAGVAVRSGYGDGTYPVIVHYNKEGRVSKVEILFD